MRLNQIVAAGIAGGVVLAVLSYVVPAIGLGAAALLVASGILVLYLPGMQATATQLGGPSVSERHARPVVGGCVAVLGIVLAIIAGASMIVDQRKQLAEAERAAEQVKLAEDAAREAEYGRKTLDYIETLIAADKLSDALAQVNEPEFTPNATQAAQLDALRKELQLATDGDVLRKALVECSSGEFELYASGGELPESFGLQHPNTRRRATELAKSVVTEVRLAREAAFTPTVQASDGKTWSSMIVCAVVTAGVVGLVVLIVVLANRGSANSASGQPPVVNQFRLRLDMPADEVLQGLGNPEDVDEEVTKSKHVQVWKYGHRSGNQFALRVTIQDGLVVGWRTT